MARNTDHIVIGSGAHELLCKHCGERYVVGMPCPIPIYSAIGKAFEKLHVNCKPKVKA